MSCPPCKEKFPVWSFSEHPDQPGNEEFDLNVRGASSTNGGNTPLVLVDGIPGDMNMINPQDIEAISVLKDASASIYGFPCRRRCCINHD